MKYRIIKKLDKYYAQYYMKLHLAPTRWYNPPDIYEWEYCIDKNKYPLEFNSQEEAEKFILIIRKPEEEEIVKEFNI